VEEILPEKMKYNLQSIRDFSLINDLKTMFATVGAVLK
jgi:lipopolysaccharide/colanic/teichoic acid biosynthesis glycosyltransferase